MLHLVRLCTQDFAAELYNLELLLEEKREDQLADSSPSRSFEAEPRSDKWGEKMYRKVYAEEKKENC